MDEFLRRLNAERFPILANFSQSLRKYFKYGLSEQDCIEGIRIPCDFFEIPMPAFIQDMTEQPKGSTMFVNYNSESYCDDVICYNLEQLQSLGVTGKDTFALVMTHECAHRVFQNTTFPGLGNGQWESEFVADFFIGVISGIQGIPHEALDAVRRGLVHSPGSKSHPVGRLRAEIISYAYTYVGCMDLIHHRKRTIPEYLQEFMNWIQKNASVIRQAQVPFYGY